MNDVHAPARRRDWALYRTVEHMLTWDASRVDLMVALMEVGVSRQRAMQLVAGDRR